MKGLKLPVIALYLVFSFCLGCSGNCLSVQPGETRIPRPQPFDYHNKKQNLRKKKLVEYITKRTVRVVVIKSLVDFDTNKALVKHKKAGWGTGTIIRSMGGYSYVLTALHVVNKDFDLDIFNYMLGKTNVYWVYNYLIERRTSKNKIIFTHGGSVVIYKDKYRDIAVLQVPTNLNIQTQIAHNIYLGEEVHIIGYPWLWISHTPKMSYTHGFIGTINLGYDKDKTGKRDHDRFDADAYMGNSGSGVWAPDGTLVGVVSWITGLRIQGYFFPRPKQTYGCSARGILKSFKSSGLRELSRF